MRRLRGQRVHGLGRHVTLLRVFLVVSGAILALGAVALSSRLSADLRDALLADTARDADAYVSATLAPVVVRDGRVTLTATRRRALARALRLPPDARGVTLYTRDGKVVFSTSRTNRPGRVRSSPQLRDTVRRNVASGQVVRLAGRGKELVKVWTPITTQRGRVVGAAEVTLDVAVLKRVTADARGTIWYAVGVVFGVLWLALALLVRGASTHMRAQKDDLAARQHDLVDSSRELEANLLETIETLNAAVEARDPYTAGHSQRVRRVSLAVGRELRLSPKQLGALATAALFHDIGKIGMPDAILTKPDRLERDEAATMREHAARGAEIVSRISSMRDSVPGIRHHHERWDGLGYPDRLSGTEIPIEAAIIALADAWDAMTTDRPYASALDMTEAIVQIHAGRGKQFNPAVVDAFVVISQRRPAELMPPDAEPASAVAV